MARRIATVSGIALAPGVSRNGRLYTAEVIKKAVQRAQDLIAEGAMSVRDLTQRTHHAADDDSTRIVGRITQLTYTEDGKARFSADIADTPHGRTIASLVEPRDPNDPTSVDPFLRGVSIRGAWIGPVRRESRSGQTVEIADDLEIAGLDYTANPGVPGAQVDDYIPHDTSAPRESDERVLIYESVQEALVETAPADVEEAGAPALKSGKPAAAQTKAKSYADPGYQDDKMPRYALDSKAQSKSAWSYINQKDNASKYTPNQLKRVRQRIIKALKGFGVQVDTEERWLIDPATEVTEALAECWGMDPEKQGSFYVTLSNGPVSVSVSSSCIDPADLDLIGRAAMDGACQAMAAIDPDMDGDIDATATSEDDTDDDMGGETAPAEQQGRVYELDASTPPGTPATPAGGTPDVPPAPEPAAEPHPEQEEPVVDEPTTTPAAEPTAAPAPVETAPQNVTLSSDQFAQLLAGLAAARTPEPALVAAETAPAPTAPAQETAPVTETEDRRIARLVQEGIAAALPTAVQEHVERNGPPSRKGFVSGAGRVTESAGSAGEVLAAEIGDQYPSKNGVPLEPHQLTRDQFSDLAGASLEQYYLGSRANQ